VSTPGVLRVADVGDERGIGLVRLRPRQATLGVRRDAGWVDEAHHNHMPRLMEAECQRRSIRAGCLQADMHPLHSLLAHTGVQRVKASNRHGEAALKHLPVDE
jgi:hypothetical protein